MNYKKSIRLAKESVIKHKGGVGRLKRFHCGTLKPENVNYKRVYKTIKIEYPFLASIHFIMIVFVCVQYTYLICVLFIYFHFDDAFNSK